MASASAMVRPPPGRSPAPRPPPPPPKSNKPRKAPPPPPPKRPPPPSRPNKRPAEEPKPAAVVATAKRTARRVPVALRDVTVFDKKKEVGKGTYGTVFVAQDRATKEVVALKHVNTKQEENGFPVTALREVKILKALNNDNIVKLKEMVTSKERSEGAGSVPKNVYMVFDFFEYDLFGILETPEIRFTIDHIKSWSRQLLLGIHYSHTNKVIHRDLKPSNLLVNLRGELKIADWGLARSWNSEMKDLTNPVITLWYRPPELLLSRGRVGYTSKIDMWSVGCIIMEMFRRSGFFRGTNEKSQLDVIFRTCGHPSESDWPDLKTKYNLWSEYKPKEPHLVFPSRLEVALTTGVTNPKWMTPSAVQLVTKLLKMNPHDRWSAQEACVADYFFEEPAVKEARELSMDFNIRSVHEMYVKSKPRK